MSADLKPCPFCGETANIVVDGYQTRWVCCDGCGATTSERDLFTDEQAIARWNRRAVPSADLTVPPLPVVAWLNSVGDEQDRVVTEQTMAAARKDGGAMLSSLRGYSDPLVRKADADAALASLQARLEAAERDARRGRHVVEHGEWFRSPERTRIAVTVALGADLSCEAMREIAIDAAIAATQEAKQ